MKDVNPKPFHKLYGVKKPRVSYQKKDFLDYTLMTLISAFIIYFVFGPNHLMFKIGIVLCAFMIIAFSMRHGLEFSIPLILKRPQDVLYMFIYKIQNIKSIYIFAVALLLLENYLIFLTPNLPHKVELMREIAIVLFYIHFIAISIYRTVILVAHLRKKELVREVLLQTFWKRAILQQPNITIEILHAYFTGILTHMILLAPWYMVITYFSFSIIFLPVIFLINIIVQLKFLKSFNVWFYRDHWLGHNSELEFLYLHGPHHDAIPSALIAVADNGYLEGFMRQTLGVPTPFCNPIFAFIYYTYEIKNDVDFHQYIPGVFPKALRETQEAHQHSIHHYGRLRPYGFGLNIDQPHISKGFKEGFKMFPDEFINSIRLDEQLTGFKWDNPRFRKYLKLVNRYQK